MSAEDENLTRQGVIKKKEVKGGLAQKTPEKK